MILLGFTVSVLEVKLDQVQFFIQNLPDMLVAQQTHESRLNRNKSESNNPWTFSLSTEQHLSMILTGKLMFYLSLHTEYKAKPLGTVLL